LSAGSDFESAFPKYVDEVLRATSEEAKAFLFLEFVRKSFSGVTSEYAEVLYPVLQKHLTRKKSVVALSGRPARCPLASAGSPHSIAPRA
jgi:hypothetical protein